ncbi:hypothetical protein NADE_009230 [Nannochloris sp. 'desiccata']|nr:hypothetical protein NADE_009230 [Chlorella desiccata (nom. nud.)]
MLLVDRLAATGVKRAAGAVTRNRLGFLKAAATQPKGQRAQLDSQPADADPFIVMAFKCQFLGHLPAFLPS